MELPQVQVRRAVVQRYARLRARFENDFAGRPLVLPNAEFFPDVFTGDEESVKRMLLRMATHAGMLDIPMKLRLVGEEKEAACASGSCCSSPLPSAPADSRVVDEGDGWLLQVPSAELRFPVLLATNLARSLAFVFLMETLNEGERAEPPMEVTADFTAVGLGFGVLMLEGAYMYAKSCSGPQIASATKVPLPELSLVVALNAQLEEQDLGPALSKLEITQRSLLSDAHSLFRSNHRLVSSLKRDPSAVIEGEFELSDTRSFVSVFWERLLSKRRQKRLNQGVLSPDLELEELESLVLSLPPAGKAQPTHKTRHNAGDELKKLVSEALGDSAH